MLIATKNKRRNLVSVISLTGRAIESRRGR